MGRRTLHVRFRLCSDRSVLIYSNRADYADDEYIRELLTWKHPHATVSDFQYTEEENMMMLRLPRKECEFILLYGPNSLTRSSVSDLTTASLTHDLYLTLLTLLFAYAYDARSTQHDPSTESAWTICSLVPAFSALDPPPYHSATLTSDFSPSELAETLMPSYRRSLAFPLYRSFAFAEACRLDVAEFLFGGRRTVVRCLLEMKNILDHHDVYYVYSKIWVEDFCVWAQAYARCVDLLLFLFFDPEHVLAVTRLLHHWRIFYKT